MPANVVFSIISLAGSVWFGITTRDSRTQGPIVVAILSLETLVLFLLAILLAQDFQLAELLQ